ncbi:MAG: hypothetical protein IAG13_02800 [Deltaproteobacteria bacterium]|nr:hypothetical protein [Nannocystaceae bacterium]
MFHARTQRLVVLTGLLAAYGCADPVAAQILTESSSGESEPPVGSDGATGSTAPGPTTNEDDDDSATTSSSSGAHEVDSSSSPATEAATTSSEATSSADTQQPTEGSATSTGETSTSDPTNGAEVGTTDATSDDGSTDATSEGTSTGGDDVEPSCPLDCAPPCEVVLSQTLGPITTLARDATRIAARDSYGEVALFDTAALAGVYSEDDTTWMALSAGVLAIAHGDDVVLRSSTDLTLLGEVFAGGERGLAVDGSYLWSADGEAMRTFATDGTELTSTAGEFTDVHVLALPDSLHVHAESYAEHTVLHVDIASGIVEQVEFEGELIGWFGDVPRFWSHQANAYRLYEPDGTEIAFGVGTIVHGWGDYVITGAGVAHVDDLVTTLLPLTYTSSRISGPALAIIGGGPGTSAIVVLDADGPDSQYFPSAPDEASWAFAWDPAGWAIGDHEGVVRDDHDQHSSIGSIDRLVGGIGGRFLTELEPGVQSIWDVVPGCTALRNGSVSTVGAFDISPDGSVIVEWMQDPKAWWAQRGSHFRGLPDGEELGFVASQAASLTNHEGFSMSDDATLAAHMWSSGDYFESDAFARESETIWANVGTNVMPALAPDGLTAVVTDAPWGFGASYEDSSSTVYSGGVFTDVFDGVSWGFIDNARVLVSHYEGPGCNIAGECEDFVGTDIVELDGTVVQSTSLPDLRRFQRVDDSSILVDDPPRIFDVYTSEILWSLDDEDVDDSAAIGEDLVATSDGLSLVVHRWR